MQVCSTHPMKLHILALVRMFHKDTPVFLKLESGTPVRRGSVEFIKKTTHKYLDSLLTNRGGHAHVFKSFTPTHDGCAKHPEHPSAAAD